MSENPANIPIPTSPPDSSAQDVSTIPPDLDSLLSPLPTEMRKHDSSKSIDSDNEKDAPGIQRSDTEQTIELTDTRFSNIPLSTTSDSSTGSRPNSAAGALRDSRSSLNGLPPSSPKSDRRNTIQLNDTDSTISSTLAESTRKRSESHGSVRSAGAAPFIQLRALELQKDGDSMKSRSNENLLQNEFHKIHERGLLSPTNANAPRIDWDFWGAVISDYQTFASERSEELAKAIERGIPDTLRGMMWQLMAASKDAELEATYLKLLKETSPHEKAIMRDLGRTFPNHSFFTDSEGIGQENLFNVLKAYSLYDEQVGFCQGLPFVVAILLLNMPDEEAFCLLVRLMHSYDIRGHFLPEMPKLQMRLFQFERLVEDMLPVLHVHFLRQGVKSTMYTSQWFLTLFSYRFPMEVVYRIYDNILASGVEAIFAFSLVLLQKNENVLLDLRFDEILQFLNNKLFNVYQAPDPTPTVASAEFKTTSGEKTPQPKYNVDELVEDAAALRITPFMLDTYAREYDDMVRVRDARAIEMDELRNSNRSLSAQLKTLESSMATLNTEHVELLNELVRARLKNEETESELVRYKLLYAEAMHKSEDAMSNTRISSAFNFLTKRGSGT